MNKPISPYIYIGYQCNNNCIFCSEADEYMEKLKPKNIKQIKEDISKVRTKYDLVNFMGREPTLRKDFIEILKYANSLEFKQVGFTTNGRMLAYPDFTKRVLKTRINQIVVSLFGGTPKMHDKQTQVKGSFYQTLKGIENIFRFKKNNISIISNLLLNKINYLEFQKMIDLVINLGIKEINVLYAAPLSRRSRTRKIVMKMSELGRHVVKTLELYNNNPDLKFLLVEFLPCSLPRKAREYFFPCLEKNPDKIRISLCKKCPYADKCDGVLKSYIDLYGVKEFKL